MRLLISIATYNERDNLAPLLEELHRHAPAADVLVVDDNSPDGTGQLAEQLGKNDSRVYVLHRTGKLGLGTAIIAAMRHAINNDYDYLLNMDADFSHHPRYLPALLAGMNRHDVMIGSRYVPGGETKNWPWSRQLLSRTVNMLARLLLRIPAHDTSGAFRCYRVAQLRCLDFERIISKGYSFQEEILYHCRALGMSMAETPIVFEDRRAGKSKVNAGEAVRSLFVLLKLGARAILGNF